MGKIIIDAELHDSGVSLGAEKLGTAFAHLERRTASGAKGLQSVEIGMRTLAAQAVGLHGPLGRVAEGLLSFAGGGTLVLGVAAGIGLITLAMKAMKEEGEQAAKATEDLEKRLTALGAHGALVAATMRVSALEVKEDEIRRQLDIEEGLPRFRQNAARQEQLSADLLKIQGEMANLINGVLIPAENRVTKEKEKQAEEEKKQTEELQKQLDIIGKLVAGDVENQFRFLNAETRAFLDAGAQIQSLMMGGTPEQIRLWWQQSPSAPDAPDFNELGRIGRASVPMGRGTGNQAAAAVAQAIAAIASGLQGGVGGALTGLGGALGSLSGIGSLGGLGPIGLGIGAGGVLISALQGLFSHSKPAVVLIDGYSSTAISQQNQVMQLLAGVLGIKVDILSAGTAGPDMTAYDLGRRARLDGGMRLPPGAMR